MKKNSLVKTSIINVIKGNKGLAVILALMIIGVVAAGLIPPQVLKYIIDNNFMKKSTDGLLLSALIYMGVILFIGILGFIKEAILTVIGQKITKEIRYEMMVKLHKINAEFFTQNESGSVVSRFTNDVDAINSMFTSGMIGMIIDCLKISGIVVSIWIFSCRLGIIILLLLPVIYFITRLFQKKMLIAQLENRKLTGKVNNHISESFKNIQMIKSFSKETYMEKRYKDVLMDNFQTIERVNFYDSVFSPVIIIIKAVVIALVVIFSAKQLNIFNMSLGMIAASIDLITSLFNPIESLGMELQNIQQSISGIRRVNEFYDEREDDKKVDYTDIKSAVNKKLNLSFDNVSFCYEGGTEILKDINLQIKPDEKVTFAGRTGVGKTTLFKLVLGLLKPTKGSITINGINVYDIPNYYKRNIFGYVDQGLNIVNGTVAEQVSLKDSSISMEQIKAALDFVGMTDYIQNLENGYNTEVKNENIFSQGQKQLIAIARAIVTNPPILLLDEITANLDSITEDKIVSVLQKAGKNHTILSISHRLSSIIASDTVVILEKGRIKNSGSPEALLQNDEWYRSHIAMEKLTWR